MKVTYKNGIPVVPKGWRKLHGNAITLYNDRYDFCGEWRMLAIGGERVSNLTPLGAVIRRVKGTK